MGNNRYNKPKGPVPDYTPRGVKKEVEVTLDKKPCLVCKKMCHAYGRHEDGHTCSSKCEKLYVKPEGEHHVEMVDCFNGRVFDPNEG
jgi:hypothetical protein